MLNQIESFARRLVDSANPSSTQKLRSVYRNLRNTIKGPVWVSHPTNVQIDLHNYCNLWMCGKGCIHCNVKPSGGWNLPRGAMGYDMMKHIIEYWGARGCRSVAPYVNGEPLFQEPILRKGYSLRDVCDLTGENGMHIEIDTNGSLYMNREYLVHPAIKQVRITFSATTPETYRIVHGADLYKDALATVEWFLKNRLPSQYPMLYFITDKYNLHELLPYIKRWRGKAHLTLFPLHEVEGTQTESTKTRPSDLNYWDKLTEKIVGSVPSQKYRPIDIYPDGRAKSRLFDDYTCCQGSHSFSVSWNGKLLHCTDIPYKYNYGYIYDRDMLEVWHLRNILKLVHPECQKCNVKHPRHNEMLRKYLHIKSVEEIGG